MSPEISKQKGVSHENKTLNANFVSNQKEGTFRAVASFLKKGKRVNVVRTIVYGKSDRLIADVTTNHVAAK